MISFLSLFVVFGVRLSFSVFFIALIDEFGWPRASASLIFSSNMAVFALTSTAAGLAMDRWGARLVFGVGAGLLAVGLYLSSTIHSLAQLMLSYGLVAGLGITILGLGLQAGLISRWFRRYRGAAIGIAFAGTGLGTLLLTPGVDYLIAHFGWRGAYRALSLLALMLVPLVTIFLRQSPVILGLSPDGQAPAKRAAASDIESTSPFVDWTLAQAVRTAPFWLLMLTGVGAIGPLRMLTVHQLAAIVDAGIDRAYGAAIIGGSGAVTALSFILSGALSDRIGRQRAYGLGSLALVGAIGILGTLHPGISRLWLLLYGLLLGMGEGTRAGMVTAVASDLFSGPGLGAINGAVGAAFGLGAAIFPWLAGRLFDVSGTYSIPFTLAALMIALSTASLWGAQRLGARTPAPG